MEEYYKVNMAALPISTLDLRRNGRGMQYFLRRTIQGIIWKTGHSTIRSCQLGTN